MPTGINGLILEPQDPTLTKLVFHFLSNLMGYDRGDSFPFDFEPNGFAFGSKSKGKLFSKNSLKTFREFRESDQNMMSRSLYK